MCTSRFQTHFLGLFQPASHSTWREKKNCTEEEEGTIPKSQENKKDPTSIEVSGRRRERLRCRHQRRQRQQDCLEGKKEEEDRRESWLQLKLFCRGILWESLGIFSFSFSLIFFPVSSLQSILIPGTNRERRRSRRSLCPAFLDWFLHKKEEFLRETSLFSLSWFEHCLLSYTLTLTQKEKGMLLLCQQHQETCKSTSASRRWSIVNVLCV